MNDPLDHLLGPRPAAADPTFRAALLRRTRSAVRRRVWARRLALAAALAACFAAGLVTMAVLTPPRPEPAPLPLTGQQPTPPGPPPVALEDQAAQKPDERAALFREAGQRYLQDQGDVESALRCYRQSLDSNAELAVAPEDDWLLIALKHARQEERRHARND
jgi:hypothetical protein